MAKANTLKESERNRAVIYDTRSGRAFRVYGSERSARAAFTRRGMSLSGNYAVMNWVLWQKLVKQQESTTNGTL